MFGVIMMSETIFLEVLINNTLLYNCQKKNGIIRIDT